jgi:hypothetical protein
MRLSLASVLLWGACAPEGAPVADVAERGACDNDRTRIATIEAGLATIASVEQQAVALQAAGEPLRPYAVRAATESLHDDPRWQVHLSAAPVISAMGSAGAAAPALTGAPLRLRKPGGLVIASTMVDARDFGPAGIDLSAAASAQAAIGLIDGARASLDALTNARAEFAASYRAIRRGTRCPLPLPPCAGCDAPPPGPPANVDVSATLATNAAEGRAVVGVIQGALAQVRAILVRMRGVAASLPSYTGATFAADARAVDDVAMTTNFTGIHLADGADSTMDLQLSPHDLRTVTLVLPDLRASTLGVDTGELAEQLRPEALVTIDRAIARVDDEIARAAAELPLIVPMPDPPPAPAVFVISPP